MTVQVIRLKRREDFQQIAASGDKWVTTGVVIQALRRPAGENDVRIGFTVSGKVGNAVKRNRARRRLKALIDELAAKSLSCGWDIVLIGRTATIGREYPLLRQDIMTAFKKLKVLAV